jgi:hypothetical protein
LEDRVDRLFFGLFDEATGIDDQKIGLSRIIRQLVFVGGEHRQNHLAVDEVFGAPQRNQSHFDHASIIGDIGR